MNYASQCMKYIPEYSLIHDVSRFVQHPSKSLLDSSETPIFAVETEITVSKMKHIFTIIQVIAIAKFSGNL